jgi:hypothetical protein
MEARDDFRLTIHVPENIGYRSSSEAQFVHE